MDTENPLDFVGLVPAAGLGSRLTGKSGSKELVEVAGQPVSAYLLDRLRLAGVRNVHLVIREEKSDIVDRFGDGGPAGLQLNYHYTGLNAGVPYSLDTAYEACKEKNVLLGFPDILFYPEDAFLKMQAALNSESGVDLVLGLFPAQNPELWDAVVMDEHHNIEEIVIKEKRKPALSHVWALAAWKPAFFDFLHTNLMFSGEESSKEIYLGHVIQEAITKGMVVKGILFDRGRCLDIGTPAGFSKADDFIKHQGG